MLSLGALFGDDADLLKESNFQMLLVANLVGAMGTALISPILDSLVGPLGASTASIGYMMSAYTLAAVFVIPITGVVADRTGRKPLLVIGILLFGLGGTLIVFVNDLYTALLLRFVQGIGFAATTPIIITSIGDMYEGSREATAQGFRFSGTGFTQVVLPLLAGILVSIAWQYPFLLNLITIPIAIALYLWFNEPMAGNYKEYSPDGFGSYQEQVSSVLSLLRYRRIQAVIFIRGLPVTVWTGFLTYNSIVVVRIMDGTPLQSGLLVAFGSLSYAASATQAGRITSRFDRRLYPLIIANLALGVGFAVMLFAHNLYVATLGIILCGGGFGITLSIYRSIITTTGPNSTRGSLVSLAEAFGRLAATITPAFMAVFITMTSPIIGFELGLQIAGLTVAVLASAGGIIGLAVASMSPSVGSLN